MRDTPYATEIETASDSIGQTIERLFVKEHGREEIRFSWWKDGQLMIRPLDLPEDELLPLMKTAMAKGVFSQRFLSDLQTALVAHLQGRPFERIDEDRGARRPRMTIAEMAALGAEIASMPLLDTRSSQAIMDDVDPL